MTIQPADTLPALTPDSFINRELSTIEFQRRVLAQAIDEHTPLLERVKFLAIVGNNLDEFYMVRVASYIQKIKLGISNPRPDGLTPLQLLNRMREEVGNLLVEQRRVYQEILTLLEAEGIRIVHTHQLDPRQREAVGMYFNEEVFPVLTPLGVDHVRPFPFISNLSLNLGVYLERTVEDGEELEFARIKVPVPDILPRLVHLNQVLHQYGDGQSPSEEQFLWIEDVIDDNLSRLFPGMTVLEAHPFRVLRNADIDYEMELDEDMMDVKSIIEESLKERRFGSVVRLSVENTISERMRQRLIHELQVEPSRDVYTINGALGSANLFELLKVDRPDLKYPPFVPRLPEALPQGSDLFATIRRQDILLHHPYDSFTPVEDFFRIAAHDPDVLAIKATLYRVGKNSPIVQELMAARENDKQVTVLVELKARFDEENNIEWAQALETKGVHVIYGVEEIAVKTHAKVALVVRRETDGVRRYVHLGTGNYNSSTARLYTDLGLFTANHEVADDASRLFNRLTGYGPATSYSRLLVAPDYLFSSLVALIDNEIEAAKEGRPARLIFKMNQLEEDVMIQKLYQASQAGVQVDLIIRGLCCLRPGVEGLSENIRVLSIVGRFLEHSRVYYFQNAPEHQQIYLGSADLMRRNIYNRVEVVFPVLDPRIQRRVLRILATNLVDSQNGWLMQADGRYVCLRDLEPDNNTDAQAIFMRQSSFGLDELP